MLEVSPRRASKLTLALVFLAVIVRLLYWPAPHELRDGDELAYAWGSLQLLEGNLPGIHYAPAGPQTWVGCLFEGAISLRNYAFPDSTERTAPAQLRPFIAINHTLFDAYRDTAALRQVWIVVSFLCAVGGVVAGSRFGMIKAGTSGALFLGGTTALLPLFVDFSVQARPYIVAWSLGIIALYFAIASPHPKALVISAIAMGLAIGSRIDMFLLLPVVWSETWRNRHDLRDWWNKIFQYHLLLSLTFIVIAPWYLMTLAACLRAIGTVRGATGLVVATPLAVFWQVIWEQGMLLQVGLFVLAILIWVIQRPRRWFLAAYMVLIGLSIFKGAAFGLRYQGAPLVLTLLAGVYALEWLRRYSTVMPLVLSLVALVLPGIQVGRLLAEHWRDRISDDATQWVEAHVPSGSIVYVRPYITNLLPTSEAADAAWAEVTNNSAYKRKFMTGLQRFGLSAEEIPRALSEVNLALERANRRFLFILGGRQWIARPRFDTRVFESGPVFGVGDLPAAFRQTGGVVILRGPAEDPIVRTLGPPTVEWVKQSGDGTRIYCSSDLTGKLH
jgi:hypothetical protein